MPSETDLTTSDGIARCDWDQVGILATEIANAAIAENAQRETTARSRLLSLLETLRRKYGERPSILATQADYVDALPDKITLLEKAFCLARETSDSRNMTFIAHSLAQLHVEECQDVAGGRVWLSTLATCLAAYSEQYERDEYERLYAELLRQEQSGR